MTGLAGPQCLVNTISLLGGPLLDSADIDWATDLPAGNAFFEWLADQLHDWSPKLELEDLTSGNAVDGGEEEKTLKIRMHVALREVALEKDEVLILRNGSSLHGASMDKDVYDVSDTDYMPLWRLKRQASYINNETALLKRETELLSSRLALSKKASQKLTQVIKSLQRTLDEVKSDIRNVEEGLSELSVNVDTSIATTLRNAKALIHALDISDPDDDLNTTIVTRVVERSGNVSNHVHISNQHARSSLVLAQTSLSAIIIDLREQTERFSFIRKEEATKNEDVQMEAKRLEVALDSMNLKTGSTNYILTMDPELEEICALFEREADSRERGAAPTDLIQNFLQALDTQDDNFQVFLKPAVDLMNVEIRHAWHLDQIALLQTHESGLDQASRTLDCVLAPLDRLHASLTKVWHCVQEAEALIEAFGDELEDVNMDFVNKTLAIKNDAQEVQNPLNPFSIASLHKDILTEHLARKKCLSTLESSEKTWIEALIVEYSSRPIHSSLPHIYANSPLTTCAPFAFPTQVQKIETQARDRAMRLENLVMKLGIQVNETFTKNDSTAKQLDAFVERWCGSV